MQHHATHRGPLGDAFRSEPVPSQQQELAELNSPHLPTSRRANGQTGPTPYAGMYEHEADPAIRQGEDDVATRRDRQRAAAQLRRYFSVVDPGHRPANAAGNVVTQQELETIAAEFSDIRRGRTDIHIDTHELNARDGAQYRANTMERFAQIMQTRSGRDLIHGLAHNPHHQAVTFGAFHRGALAGEAATQEDIEHTPVVHHENAEAVPTNAAGQLDRDAGNVRARNGTGTSVRVLVNPEDDDRLGDRPWARRDRGDIQMVHEMVHAYHMVRGALPGVDDRVSGGVDDHVAQAEHQAVGLGRYATAPISENAYRRERQAIGRGTAGVLPGDERMLLRDSYDTGHGSAGPSEDPRCTVGCSP